MLVSSFWLKEYGAAYRSAKKAEKVSYGDNWLRTVGLLAEIKIAQQKKQQAKKILDQALKEVVLPRSTQVRTHRYLAKLRKLYDQLLKLL